jgi:protein gp37
MKTKIEWTEATWNPIIGCDKVSDGCKNCYAEKMSLRLQAMSVKGYEQGFQLNLIPNRLAQPVMRKKPTKYFVNSMSDLFHENVPFSYIDLVFEVIKKTPYHIYQILTKRADIMFNYFSDRKLPRNVWLGVTVENEITKHRIEYLKNIDAEIRFISMEPLLEDLGELNLSEIHWAIVGGESGANARKMEKEWILNIQNQCNEQKVAFFFKQWGTWGADGKKRNKKANGRLIDGELFNSYPK